MKKIINPEKPSMSFRDWMWKIVKSQHYTDENAMSRAEESLKKELC